MSAPTSSFEIDTLTEEASPDSGDFVIIQKITAANEIQRTQLGNLGISTTIPFTWAASDEDSPLSSGVLYTTEAASTSNSLADVILSLKNAPTGSSITVDILKETGVNTNVFATIFSTLPTIDITDFTSQTATIPPVLSDTTWEIQRRLQIFLSVNDSNFIASGLKVTLI